MASRLKQRRRDGETQRGFFRKIPRLATDEYHIVGDDESWPEESRGALFAAKGQHDAAPCSGRFCDQTSDDGDCLHPSPFVELMDTDHVDALLPRAAAAAFVIWLMITFVVYASAPSGNRVHLQGAERTVAFLAFVIFVIMILTSVLPYLVGFQGRRQVSGVMIAGLVIQLVALLTNALLTWGPVVVYTDPVTTSLAYLTRYCEWTPLAGFMTFLSEAIDLPADRPNMTLPIATSLLQLCSAGCGILCPLCPNAMLWCTVMSISCLTYGMMFVRVWQKRRRYMMEINQAMEPRTAAEIEHRDRLLFAYRLVVACTVCWTFLVVLYFVNMAIHLLTSPDHFLRIPGLAMMVDTLFDVTAKIIYSRLIVCVHESVFDEMEQSRRRLEELRRLLSAVWESSSDVIVISVRNKKGAVSVMLSPSYESLIGGFRSLRSGGDLANSDGGKSLLVELQEGDLSHHRIFERHPSFMEVTERTASTAGVMTIKTAYLMDSELSVHDDSAFSRRKQRLLPISLREHGVVEVERLLHSIWQHANHAESTHIHDMIKSDGSVAKCEVKVTQHSYMCAISAMIRDTSERYRLAELKQRTILEAIARQKDAQTANQFTRHQIKNGLLGSIELCASLRTSLQKQALTSHSLPVGVVDQLDSTLNETLEAIVEEAMARDVMHQVYHPRLERIDVLSTLKSCPRSPRYSAEGSSDKSSNRFSLISRPSHFPPLWLDPQLIKYVHRRAVSNACKYGKAGGPVTTEVCYLEETKQFLMTITNLPGTNHDKLVAMGKGAEEAVFSRGKRLQSSFEPTKSVASTGDGGWMIRKCAEAMRGNSSIRFYHDKTVLTFHCPTRHCDEASSEAPLPWGEPSQFTVPQGTWAIAVDDSKVQRKLMSKLLTTAGVAEDKQVILGETAEEIRNLVRLMLEIVRSNPTSHVLILMDENLDFMERGEQVMVSGSKSLQEMLSMLSEGEEDRVLGLVRSANDSSEDLDIYSSRAHGYFPKAPMKRERIRELLSESWYCRFHSLGDRRSASCEVEAHEEVEASRKETIESLSRLGHLISLGVTASHWPGVREALGRLKVNLIRRRYSPKAKLVVELLEGVIESDVVPMEFDRIWGVIRETVMECCAQDCPSMEHRRQ